MSVLVQLSAILLVMFAILLGGILYKLHKTKRKLNVVDYSTAAVFGIFVVGSLLGVVEHFILGLFTIFVGSLFCIILIPFSRENAQADVAEAMKNVDLSEPIRFRDFFSWKFVPKLERKYGERKTLAIYIITFLCLGGVSCYLTFFLIENLILVNAPGYRGTPVGSIVGAIAGSLIGSIIGYRNTKEALKNLKNTPTDSTKQGN